MVYNLQDVYMGISGDFEVNARGDLRLANSFESVKQTINFIARTDKGDYVPDVRIGADLGRHIGEVMSEEIFVNMEKALIANISRFLLNRSDFQAHVIPITMDTVGVFIAVGGQYLDADGNVLDAQSEVISFTFPYFDGEPTPY